MNKGNCASQGQAACPTVVAPSPVPCWRGWKPPAHRCANWPNRPVPPSGSEPASLGTAACARAPPSPGSMAPPSCGVAEGATSRPRPAVASGRRAEPSHTGWRHSLPVIWNSGPGLTIEAQVSNPVPGLAIRVAALGPCSFSLTMWPGAALCGGQGCECQGRGVPGAFTTMGLRDGPQEQAGGRAGDQALSARCPWVQKSQVIKASITTRGVRDGWGVFPGVRGTWGDVGHRSECSTFTLSVAYLISQEGTGDC